jgi:hypothetical protein
MATSKADIRHWLKRGLADTRKPTHCIIVCDTFDYEDYPVYVFPGEDVRDVEKKNSLSAGNMQRVMEVYNLALPIEAQLEENRSFNY